MDRIFYGCSSLKILDISNFNFLSVINATQIFSIHSISNLEYINLYNIKDTNIISTSLLNTDDTIENIFYIC
jgi:surface protein